MQLSRLHKIIILISLCLLAQLSISWKAWLPVNRQFPLISAFASFPVHYGVFIDGMFSGILVVCLIGLTFKPFSKLLIVAISVFFFLLVLEDITRFQPWLFMYALILLSAAFTKANEQQALFIIRIILVGTYFWSGAQKFNHAFTVEIFPWLMRPLGLESFFELHHRLAYGVSFIEVMGAIGLLFRKYQKYAGILLITIHLSLIYTLGPLGNNWNKLIWPWDATLIGIIALSISNKDYNGAGEIKLLWKNIWFVIVFLLTCIMPAFNFFGYWDYYLSGSLYSGNIPRADFYYSNADIGNMPQSAHNAMYIYTSNNTGILKIDKWALDELNTPVYPEERYLKRIGTYLDKKVSQPGKSGLIIYQKEKFTSRLQFENIPGKDLQILH